MKLYHDSEEFLFVEKYRPRTVEACILPPRLKKKFQALVDKGQFASFTMAGTSGTGKTTIAKAICNELELDVLVINASLDMNKDTLRNDISKFASTVSMFSEGKKKVVILDEADYLHPVHVQPGLRGFIEEFSNNCVFILTCNYKNKLIPQLHSRAPIIDFTLKKEEKPQMMSDFMKVLMDILDKENVGYEQAALAGLIKKNFPDFRGTLNQLQSYSASGCIDSGILVEMDNTSVAELSNHLKSKDFGKIRSWIIDNNDSDFQMLLRKVYDSLYNRVKQSSIPELVLIISDYQYKSGFSVDLELNFLACMVEIMSSLEFK